VHIYLTIPIYPILRRAEPVPAGFTRAGDRVGDLLLESGDIVTLSRPEVTARVAPGAMASAGQATGATIAERREPLIFRESSEKSQLSGQR
jgi:hypothetical protein